MLIAQIYLITYLENVIDRKHDPPGEESTTAKEVMVGEQKPQRKF